VSWRARATEPHRGGHGIWSAATPAEFLGFYEEFDLTREWHSFSAVFSPSADELAAVHCLWFGYEAVSVEMDDFSFEIISPPRAAAPAPSSGNGGMTLSPPAHIAREMPI
jgi:hypothetical protein